MSLGSSQDQQIAIAVQRGNANIMSRATKQQRGEAWKRRRHPRTLPRPTSRARGRGRGGSRGVTANEVPHSRATSHAARLIGLPSPEAHSGHRGCSAIFSWAETEAEDSEESPSTPSFASVTLTRDSGGQQTEERVSGERGRGGSECAAGVGGRGIASAGDHGELDDDRSAVTEDVAASAVVVDGVGRATEESRKALCEDVMCGEVVCADAVCRDVVCGGVVCGDVLCGGMVDVDGK
jgi:hypothetical protein